MTGIIVGVILLVGTALTPVKNANHVDLAPYDGGDIEVPKPTEQVEASSTP